MSTKMGTIEGLPRIDVGILQIEAGVRVEVPVRYSEGATIDIAVYTSDAGIELVALPCALTPSKARELANLLHLAILRADGEGAE